MKDRVGRHRYVVFQVEGGENLETGEMIQALQEASTSLAQDARPWLVLFRRGQGIVRCSHIHKEEVIQLLQSIREAGGREVRIRTLGTSGTVRRAMKKYMAPSSQGGNQP
ncbi:MAG: Rpp14/Pop5 family protein [Thermoplasmata archaeon]